MTKDPYKYILHPNNRYTVIKASTAARWAQERSNRPATPSKAAKDHARLMAKRRRGRAARARRKAKEISTSWQIRSKGPVISARIPT